MRRRTYVSAIGGIGLGPGLLPRVSFTEFPVPAADELVAQTDDTESTTVIDATIGDLIEGEQMLLVVEDVTRGVDLGEFAEPADGNEFVSVSVALKNIADEFVHVSNFVHTRIRDADGYSYSQTFFAGDEPTFNDGQFAPGEVERGAITYEIPEDAEGLELVWDFTIDLFEPIDRVFVNLEEAGEIHPLEQELRIAIHDVGTAVEFADVEVTVTEVRFEGPLGPFAEPASGNEFAIIDITVENNSGEEQQISTFLQMLLKDGSGYSYQEDISATVALDRPFDEGTPIIDGESRRGELAYEVEADEQPLYWVFEFTLWVDGDKTFWQVR